MFVGSCLIFCPEGLSLGPRQEGLASKLESFYSLQVVKLKAVRGAVGEGTSVCFPLGCFA